MPITGAIVFVLWLLTLAATTAPWYIVTGFWLVIGSVIGWMAWRDLRKDQAHLDSYGARLASALKRNAADVYDVRAVAFVEFEEFEDEGATYAFDLGDGRIAFIQGQEFYEGARFPSLDFSMVYALDESGLPAEMWIEKRGERARPARIIPADAKHQLEIPDHLAIRLGKLDDIEATLRPRR